MKCQNLTREINLNAHLQQTEQKRKIGSLTDMSLLLMLIVLPVAACIQELTAIETEIVTQSAACSICKCNGTAVDCADKRLTNETIPKDIPSNTTILDMSGNQLGTLGDGVFSELTKLEKLILFNSSITHLFNETFSGLSNLQELDISCNEPLSLTNETTPEGLFRPMENLKVLKMYGNVGTYNNHYNYIDIQLSSLANIEEVWIDGFTENPFGKVYRNLTSLKTLHIAGDSFPKSWRWSEFCQIQNVTATFFENLIHVVKFTIKHCGIESIDKQAFGKLHSLQYLDLSGNQHLELADVFHSLCNLNNPNLTTLYMNSMGSRPAGRCGVHLTKDMAKCLQNTSLQELHIDYNQMSFIEFNALSHLPKSIKHISAEGNDFEIGFYIFQAFKLSNVTSINMPYQGYISDISIWHKGKQDLTYPKSIDMPGNSDSDHEKYAEDEQLQGSTNKPPDTLDQHYHETHVSMAEQFQNILRNKRVGYAIQRDERQPNRTVGDHRVCPQYNNGKYIPPGTVTVFLPPLLTYLDVSHSRLGNPIFETFVNESNSIKMINASNSMLYCWDGPIHGLTKLEYLDLSYNFCENVSPRMFEGLANLKYLNIGFNFLSTAISRDLQGKILENLDNLQTLVLQYNNIDQLSRVFFKSLVSLEILNLRGNSLETFDVEIGHMTKLRHLILRYNRIKTLSPYTRATFNVIATSPDRNTTRKGLCVDLRNISVHCYCNDVDFKFIKWAYNNYDNKCNKYLTVKLSKCHFDDQEEANFTTREEFSAVLDELEDSCRSYTVVIVCVSVLLAVIINIIIAVTVHRYRWRLQYWYFVVLKGDGCCRRRRSRQGYMEIGDSPEYIYDAYVASCDDQDEFIIDKLRVELKKHALCTFLQSIHISPGKSVPCIIGNTIHQSRVMIFILSEGWSKDYEMVTAYQMWRHDKGPREAPFAIGVKLGKLRDDDLHAIPKIQADVFYDYPGEENEHDVNAFWTTLVQTIQSRGTANAEMFDNTRNVVVQ